MADKKNKFLKRYWVLLFFLFTTLLIFRKTIFSGFLCISPSGDEYHCFYAWSYYFVSSVKEGIFPWWDFMSLCGQPFGIDPPTHINILNFLALFMGPKTAWSIRYILCIFLAGYFTYLYARSVNISKTGSVICGTIYMFTDTVLFVHFHSVSFFIPLIFICLDKAVISRKKIWIALASLMLALYYFNGNVQYALFLFIFSSCYMAFRYYAAQSSFNKITILNSLILYSVLSFCFSSVQLFRMLEMGKVSQRISSFHSAAYFTLMPTHLITAIFPYFYESPFRPDSLNFFFGRLWVEAVGKLPAIFGKPGLSAVSYVGVLPVILGIIAFLKARPKTIEKFYGSAAIIVLIFMSTSFFLHMFIKYIPFLNQMHQLQRSFLIYEFSLPILAGIGFDMLLKDKRTCAPIANITNRVLLITTGGIAAIFFGAHLFISSNKTLFVKVVEGFVDKYITANPSYTAGATLYKLRLSQLYQLLCSWTDIFNPSFLISAVLVVASVVFIGLYIKDNIKRSLFQIVAIFLILVDLFIITAVRLRFVPAKDVAPTFGVTEFLKREKGLFRIFRLQDIRDPMEPMDAASFLRPNTHLFYGLSSIEGWKSLMPSRYIEFIRVFEKGTQRQLDGLTAEFQDFDPRILNLMNVTYIITSTKRNLRGLNFELVCEGDGYRVFKNLNALPRAFIFYKHKVVTDKAEILATIGSPSFELDKEIILEEPLPLIVSDTKDASSANKDKVEIVNYQPHLVDIATETQKGGYLFLSDSYDAGWKAYLDGKYVKIYKADYIFRAVPLPKGRHKVLFLYKPASLKAGFLFTAIGFIISIAIMAKDMPHKK